MAAKRKPIHNPRQTGKRRRQAATWLRTQIAIPLGRLLRVLIYARFSSDEQNPRSIADQVAYCRDFLETLGITTADIEILSDEGISGEIVSRPGIDRVFAGFQERRWDIAMGEDTSRFYRHETAAGELIETAVDEGIRVICINDYLDTDQEDWEDRLHEALRHHAKANHYTSRRIKRAHSALWEMDAAVGMLKPGYFRKPTALATESEPARGPFFDEVDLNWASTIVSIFEGIAAGDAPQAVAQRATIAGLPKSANSKSNDWSEKNIIALIRRPDYRGFQTFRDTISKKNTGPVNAGKSPMMPKRFCLATCHISGSYPTTSGTKPTGPSTIGLVGTRRRVEQSIPYGIFRATVACRCRRSWSAESVASGCT